MQKHTRVVDHQINLLLLRADVSTVAEAVGHALTHYIDLAVFASYSGNVVGVGFAGAVTGSVVAAGRAIAGGGPALVAAPRGAAGTAAYPAALRAA